MIEISKFSLNYMLLTTFQILSIEIINYLQTMYKLVEVAKQNAKKKIEENISEFVSIEGWVKGFYIVFIEKS